MKVAVASMGTVPEAWVGTQFGMCSQFLVFDLDTMECVVVSVPPHSPLPPYRGGVGGAEGVGEVSLAAIRAVARQGVSAVITGQIKDVCRQTLLDLGIEVIDGVEGMTVQEAIERYKTTGLQAPAARKGVRTRVAVVSQGEGLEAFLGVHFGTCSSFVVVDPTTMEWEVVRVEPDGPAPPYSPPIGGGEGGVNLKGIRAVVRSGAEVLITPHIHPECCMALQALAVTVYLAPEELTVREALERYRQGELEPSLTVPFRGL